MRTPERDHIATCSKAPAETIDRKLTRARGADLVCPWLERAGLCRLALRRFTIPSLLGTAARGVRRGVLAERNPPGSHPCVFASLRHSDKQKAPCGACLLWRRGRDSNPR